MNESKLLNRIALDSSVLAGKPVIRGTRLSVQYILNLLSAGETVEEITEEYQGLTKEDIRACLLYASKTMENISDYPMDIKAG